MMHVQRPDISPQILLDALEFAVPGGWAVSDQWIERHRVRLWDRKCGAAGASKATCLVRLLTQIRKQEDFPATLNVSMTITDAGRKFSGINTEARTDWPENAQTGEFYLRSCAYHDYCLAAINGSDAEVKEAWAELIPGAESKSTQQELAELNRLTSDIDGTAGRRVGETHAEFGRRVHEALAEVHALHRLANVDSKAATQHALPVALDIFQAALDLARPQPGGCLSWRVSADVITCGGYEMWESDDGMYDAPECYEEDHAALKHLLKSRPNQGLPNWRSLSPDRRLTFVTKGSYPWPMKAKTGAEYVEACAWYDRVSEELAQKSVAPFTHDGLTEALEKATPYELSDVNKVKKLVQQHVPAVCETVIEVDAVNLRRYNIRLSMGGEYPETVHWPIPNGATGCIGDRFVPQLVGDGVTDDTEALTAMFSKTAPNPVGKTASLGAPVEPTPLLGEPHAKTWWREQFKKDLEVEIEGDRIILKVPGQTVTLPVGRPEQSWERTKRVAASAGYAHVQPQETKDEYRERGNHEHQMRRIEAGCEGYGRFARFVPEPPRSGTRTDALGWATYGHAVTDGATGPGAGSAKGAFSECPSDTRGRWKANKEPSVRVEINGGVFLMSPDEFAELKRKVPAA